MNRTLILLCGLTAASILTALVALGSGAVAMSSGEVLRILLGPLVPGRSEVDPLAASVLLQIRLPRVVLALGVGAALGTSGAVLQGLFRNPLADPTLIGVSSGAGLAASAVIVLGGTVWGLLGTFTLPETGRAH